MISGGSRFAVARVNGVLNSLQLIQYAIHFLFGVVVNQPNAQKAAIFLYPEALG